MCVRVVCVCVCVCALCALCVWCGVCVCCVLCMGSSSTAHTLDRSGATDLSIDTCAAVRNKYTHSST